MPVLGHAFVGSSTALAVTPRPSNGTTPTPRASAFWVPAVLVLAYAPDVLSQAGLVLGWHDAPRAAHSVALALLLAPLAGLGLGSLLGVDKLVAAAVACGSIVAHDLLDPLQSPGRQPFWPFSSWHSSAGAGYLPASGWTEALLFAAVSRSI